MTTSDLRLLCGSADDDEILATARTLLPAFLALWDAMLSYGDDWSAWPRVAGALQRLEGMPKGSLGE